MTLLLTEIHPAKNLSDFNILFAADRMISFGGNFHSLKKKIFAIPNLKAGIGFFGLAEFQYHSKTLRMDEWVNNFIIKSNDIKSLSDFADKLAIELNKVVEPNYRLHNISGFHLCGFNENQLPEFWFIRNVDDDRTTFIGKYEAREDFLRRDAKDLGYDGINIDTFNDNKFQYYRNGDIRAHVFAWEKFDEGFGYLFKEPDFKKLRSNLDYEIWTKYKMKSIAHFYKEYCKKSIIGGKIDAFTITNVTT